MGLAIAELPWGGAGRLEGGPPPPPPSSGDRGDSGEAGEGMRLGRRGSGDSKCSARYLGSLPSSSAFFLASSGGMPLQSTPLPAGEVGEAVVVGGVGEPGWWLLYCRRSSSWNFLLCLCWKYSSRLNFAETAAGGGGEGVPVSSGGTL